MILAHYKGLQTERLSWLALLAITEGFLPLPAALPLSTSGHRQHPRFVLCYDWTPPPFEAFLSVERADWLALGLAST